MAGKPKTQPPAFDFTSLVPTEVAPPVRQSSISAADNPALPWVRKSWEGKKVQANSGGQTVYLGLGQQVIVPTANASQTESLIRRAADALTRELQQADPTVRIGVAIQTEENPKVDGKVQRNMTAVRFAAKTAKKPYTRKPKAADNAQTTN